MVTYDLPNCNYTWTDFGGMNSGMALWWIVPLILVTFVWTVNEFLKGQLSQLVSATLAVVIFGLVAVAFLVTGWQAGLAALFGAMALSALIRPLAATVASWLRSL